MKLTDYTHFKMPKDRELLFSAVAVMQNFVNEFPQKMRMSDVGGWKCIVCGTKRTNPEACHKCGETQTVPACSYDLLFSHDIGVEDWQLFVDAGMVLRIQPIPTMPDPDMVVDLTEERLGMFQSTGKHSTQVCGIMSGVALKLAMPILKRVDIRLTDFRWATIGNDPVPSLGIMDNIPDGRDLFKVGPGMYTGMVGRAGWETYLAAAMGFPVMEIVPATRPRRWLSKWSNGGYRVVDSPDPEDWPRQVLAAMKSVETEIMQKIAKLQEATV